MDMDTANRQCEQPLPCPQNVQREPNSNTMRAAFVLLLAVLLPRSLAASVTLDQFWPWVSPHPLELGISFADFRNARPAARDISGKEANPAESFEGDLIEAMADGSVFVYIFLDGKLATASWGLPASPGLSAMLAGDGGSRDMSSLPPSEIAKKLLVVRSSLLQTCGEPVFGTSGRINAGGGVARIVWEQYRPRMDHDYVITLKATSESGIEVEMSKLEDADQRGIKVVPPTYEEVVQSLPASVQSGESTSVLIDLLDEVRSGRLTASPETQEHENHVKDSAGPASPHRSEPERPSRPIPRLTNPSGEPPSPPWWPVVAVVATSLGLLCLWLKRRK